MNNDVPYIDATFYVQVVPEFSPYTYDGEQRVTGAVARRITQTRPAKPVADAVLVKLTINLPKAAFLPLRPEAVVVVPADFLQSAPMYVDAEDANEEAL